MKIGIIVGSQRENAQSVKIAKKLQSLLSLRQIETELIDLYLHKLPLWDEEQNQTPETKSIWQPISQTLKSCTAFIVVTPEWNGMATPAIKNFFLYTNRFEVGHKPTLLVGVSATRAGGSYPIAELRMSSYKNCRILYIPEQLIFREVETIWNKADFESETDNGKYMLSRAQFALDVLVEYADILKNFNSEKFNASEHKNGM